MACTCTVNFLMPSPHYAREMKNATLSLWLGLLSILSHHENGALRKCSSNRKNLVTTASCFSVDGKQFDKLYSCHSSTQQVFFKYQSTPTGGVFNLILFSRFSNFKYLGRSFDGASEYLPVNK